jgi:transposase
MRSNRRRVRGARGQRLLRLRGERLERTFAHLCETGGMRRVHFRGHDNIRKRLLIHVGGFNLGLLMRQLMGVGTPRALQGRLVATLAGVLTPLSEAITGYRTSVPLFSRRERLSIATNPVAQIGVRELTFTTG